MNRPAAMAVATISAFVTATIPLDAATRHNGMRPESPELAERLDALDARVAEIKDLDARFVERKRTALLKEPLVSAGRIRITSELTRWDTDRPHPSVMIVTEQTVRIYYPQRSLLEVYELGDRLRWLAASPLPRLATVRRSFALEQIPAASLDPSFDDDQHLALRLRPDEAALREYVDHVDVVFDLSRAVVVRADVIDADGDRIELSFHDIRVNVGLSAADLTLRVPEGTTVSRPLSGGRKNERQERQ